jgi:OmcA/MtrC family decaheme c-type cytochrome
VAAALAVIFPGAAFADKKATRPPDYNAVTPKAAAIFGPVGVVVKIQSAAIAKNGTITARVTITDSAGTPLDRLGVYTAGPVSISLIAATIPAGQTQYFSYTTSVSNPTNTTNAPQIQAANDSGGTFVQNAIGDYTYTFHTLAPANFDATATHTIGVSAQRDLSAFGTYDEWSETSNDVFNFVPNGAPVTVTRSIVATAACNGCHDPMIGHGGSRLKVELCIMCHTPQTINTDTQLTMDMKVLIHKIHEGSSLPSVVAGTPYRIWHRGAWSDFSAVVFPQPTENCTTCHTAGQAQSDNWKTNPSSAACGSCHDNVNFATGVNHVNLPVNDTQCKQCHVSTPSADFDASIPGAHVVANNSAQLPGLVMNIMSVTGATPGSAPVVTFSVKDKKGNPVDISQITQIRVVLGGQNVDYGVGANGLRVSEDPSKTPGSAGVYTYTMTTKLPATATGSYTISLEAHNTVTLDPGTTVSVAASDNAIPVEYYFSVDKSPVVARRVVVATSKCASCHSDLSFVHSGTRGNTQECVICHNPTLVDGTSKMTVNYAEEIHSIHRGSNLANPYVIGTTNYQSVLFPGDLRDCATCHVNSSYQVDNVGAVAPVMTTAEFITPTTLPIAAACLGCHDTKDAASHALANTTTLGENCVVCHGINGAFALDIVHAR